MADRTGLGILGFILGGVTAVVLLIAALVVTKHVDGEPALGDVEQRPQLLRTTPESEPRHLLRSKAIILV